MALDVTVQSPHQALYRRWRAQKFAQIVGQDAVVTTLRNAVRLERIAHGLLFVGPRGTGKTSMARIVAKAVNCLAPVDGEPCDACEPCIAIREGRALDVIELDAASNNRVDDMRELLPRVYTGAADLRRKVFIIDEVQRIKEGWDVLLKTLEEPPDGVLFVFCTTDPSQIRPAVVSRLQRFTFRPLSGTQITGKLRRIAESEGGTVSDAAIELIASRAAGGMRDAESLLDQVLASGADHVDEAAVQDLLGLAETETVDAFITALVDGDPLSGVRLLDELEREGRDLVSFGDQVVSRLREQLLATLGAGSQSAGAAALLARAARRLSGLDVNRSGTGGYRLQLELALLEPAATAAPPPTQNAVHAAAPAPRGRAAPAVHGLEEAPSSPAQDALRSSAQDALRSPAPDAMRSFAPDGPRSSPTDTPRSLPPNGARPAPEGTQGAQPGATSRGEVSPASRVTRSTAAGPGPAAAAASATSPLSADEELFERLRGAWPEVVAHVARNPANRPLIAACRPVEIRDGVVVLGFPESQAFLRDIAERKRSALEEGVASVLGRSIAVRCVATNVEMLDPLPAGTGDELVAQARRIFEDDLVDVVEVD